MKAADTSVVIAAFASWHEHHEQARRALDASLKLIEHCALESYSVLTRLPSPHRTSARVARDFLQARFPRHGCGLAPRPIGMLYQACPTVPSLEAPPTTRW